MKRFFALFTTMFLLLTAVPVFAAESSFVSTSSHVVAVTKKKVVKKKKKVVKKAVKSTEGKPKSEVGAGVSTFKNANYTGSFPAPEGTVLEGTSGEDTFKNPTGNGKYRFQLQTAWKNHLACNDTTRTIIGSKGKTWEEGWYKGYDIGRAEGQKLIASYDETPQGAKAGNEFYDEGYRLGYSRGFDGLSVMNAQYNCKGPRMNLSDYDADGWYKIKLDKIPGLKSLYLPYGYAGLATGSSLLGKDGVYVSFDYASKAPLNTAAAPLNFTRADFLVSDLDAAEQKMTMKELAQGVYDVMTTEAGKKYKNVCTFDAPLIEDHTYGSNTFTNLNWVTLCNTGSDAGPSWMLNTYSFKKLPGNKMLVVQLFSPLSVKAKGKNELDTSKFPSADFIDQLYSKMQF